ncbi:hypothetical protein Pint_17682 [Pistacia integerrima]|uniref:Uncharacterized protein n=1 Tax=Pistacia integerrima TaxID=434235 RepID=A0ACC0YVU5_9ROSI|nr:hypothetical protein Pint_17682 [Pistacia integerrima]
MAGVSVILHQTREGLLGKWNPACKLCNQVELQSYFRTLPTLSQQQAGPEINRFVFMY